jgi:hypothetical protein
MERAAAAGALTAGALRPDASLRHGPLTRAAATYSVSLARAADDEDVRGLLRESAFGGAVRVSLEREPDSLLAGTIEGDVHGTVAARDRRNGALAGIAGRSVRDAYINGAPCRLGYLGQLRIDPRYRGRRELLGAGFDFCRQLHAAEDDARLYLASVAVDNLPARRLLGRRAAGWPRFEPFDTLTSLAISAREDCRRHTRAYPRDVELLAGSANLRDEIVACLGRNLPRFQAAPRWSSADFSSTRTRGLDVSDFTVAVRRGRVVGCAACWDQRAFKQVVVRGYAPRLARWRRAVNLLSAFTGAPTLPPAGSRLPLVYVSHAAVDGDDEDVWIPLIARTCERAAERAAGHALVAFSTRHPALPLVRRFFRARAYDSVLYVAFWPDGEALARSLDGRPSHPEAAIL